jgi:hypothetical protein
MLEKAVIGHVMSGGLADTLVSLAAETENGDSQFFLHFRCYGMNIVADQVATP